MTKPRLNLSHVRADGARVEVSFTTPEGSEVKGAIAESFFEDFMGSPQPQLTASHRRRIVEDNREWLAMEAERLRSLGHHDIVIT